MLLSNRPSSIGLPYIGASLHSLTSMGPSIYTLPCIGPPSIAYPLWALNLYPTLYRASLYSLSSIETSLYTLPFIGAFLYSIPSSKAYPIYAGLESGWGGIPR
jgi:hypothetical protein